MIDILFMSFITGCFISKVTWHTSSMFVFNTNDILFLNRLMANVAIAFLILSAAYMLEQTGLLSRIEISRMYLYIIMLPVVTSLITIITTVILCIVDMYSPRKTQSTD